MRSATSRRARKYTNLDLAFLEMRRQGLVARQNFLCCQGCGLAAIAREADRRASRGEGAAGYAFYHTQDNRHRRAGGDFYLGFGRVEGGGSDDEAVGRVVCECLAKHDVGYDWGGDPSQRISVKAGSITRRRPPSAARRAEVDAEVRRRWEGCSEEIEDKVSGYAIDSYLSWLKRRRGLYANLYATLGVWAEVERIGIDEGTGCHPSYAADIAEHAAEVAGRRLIEDGDPDHVWEALERLIGGRKWEWHGIETACIVAARSRGAAS